MRREYQSNFARPTGSPYVVSRPSMRFVAIKTKAQQAAAGVHKSLPLARTGVREMLVKQRPMLINTCAG